MKISVASTCENIHKELLHMKLSTRDSECFPMKAKETRNMTCKKKLRQREIERKRDSQTGRGRQRESERETEKEKQTERERKKREDLK